MKSPVLKTIDLHVRVEPDVVERLVVLSRARERSLSGEVRLALKNHLTRERVKPREPVEKPTLN